MLHWCLPCLPSRIIRFGLQKYVFPIRGCVESDNKFICSSFGEQQFHFDLGHCARNVANMVKSVFDNARFSRGPHAGVKPSSYMALDGSSVADQPTGKRNSGAI